MLRKLVAAGAITAALGGAVLGAAPAQADDTAPDVTNGAGNFSLVNVQPCRSIDAAGIGGAVHNVLGNSDESGPCVNNPVNAG